MRQAAQQSGWSRLRQALVQRYHLTGESIRPRDGWLVEQLLALVERLLAQVEAGEGLTAEEQVAVADLRPGRRAVNLTFGLLHRGETYRPPKERML